jgi:DNA-binding phage protein
MMTDDRTPEERLIAASNLYLNACEDRSGYMADLKRAIREAAEAKIPKLKIAQLAGVSRQTVYDALQGGQP